MTKLIAQTYTYTNGYRTYMTYGLLGIAGFLALFYAFNVYAVVSHTVALQKVMTETASLGSEIQTLNSQYLTLSSAVTPDSLSTHGLIQGKVSAYISKTSSLGRVAYVGGQL